MYLPRIWSGQNNDQRRKEIKTGHIINITSPTKPPSQGFQLKKEDRGMPTTDVVGIMKCVRFGLTSFVNFYFISNERRSVET